jgi:hypothetical protein
MSKRIRPLVLALAMLVVGIVAAPASAATMKAHLSGVVKRVNMSTKGDSFTLRTGTGRLVVIHVGARTRYTGIPNGFHGLRKGAHLGVRAVLRASDHTWWATSVARMTMM